MPKSVEFITSERITNMMNRIGESARLSGKSFSRKFHYKHGAEDKMEIRMIPNQLKVEVTNNESIIHFYLTGLQSGHTDIAFVAQHVDGYSVVGRTLVEYDEKISMYMNRIINREFNVRPE